MSFLLGLIRSVGRIVFLRGSPERIYYTRRLFIVSLLLALLASGTVQWLLFDDHVVFILLRVFAEVTMFMLMMVILTARMARFRLARMMLTLVLINLFMDVLLACCGLFVSYRAGAVEAADALAYAVGAVAVYGAGNAMAWGLQRPLWFGIGVIGAYLVAAIGLDTVFRHLYGMMAG